MAMPPLRAFEPGLYFGALPDGGLVVADTTDYTLKILDGQGRVSRVIRRPIDPKPVGRSEREAEKQRRTEELESRPATGGVRMIVRGTAGSSGSAPQAPGAGAVREMLRGQLEDLQYAEEIPVLAGMKVDPWSGTIWVRRTGDEIGETGPIDLLDASGTYLGTLSADMPMPAAFGPDGLVAIVETDEFDVQTVRIERVLGVR